MSFKEAKAILVERDVYLLALVRYVVLNPVRAHMVKSPADWPWSSYRATVGQESAPNGLKQVLKETEEEFYA